MNFTKDDIICTDKYLQMESSDIVYIKTDLLHQRKQSMTWRGKDHVVRPANIWITGHSDFPITQSMFDHYSNSCKKWFSVNKDYQHPCLYSLPLGITNCTNESSIHPIYGNTDIMMEVMSIPRTIKNLVYMNFNTSTYLQERVTWFEMFKNKSWVSIGEVINTLEGRRTFLQDIRNHTFVFCPRGNGIDTHRLWETLYMGSIPIVKRHTALEEFSDLPILFIDDLNEK